MNENIKLFLEKFAQDEELQAKFRSIKDADEAYAAASAVQGGFTKDEFVEAMTSLTQSGEISDDDVAAVAGGGGQGISELPPAISATVSLSISELTGAGDDKKRDIIKYSSSAAV